MRLSCSVVLVLLCGAVASAQPQRHREAVIVPVPGKVAVDGDLGDWDLSGALDCAFDESLRPKFVVRVALMYDASALYIAASFNDDTPLRNRHDPKVEPNKGWAADALQVRLCSNPKAPYPLPNSNDDRICHLTMWFYTDRREPVLHLQYGMDYHGTKVWVGSESGVAFKRHPDGKGYTLEARIPWERLNAAEGPPKAGDHIALVVQPQWSDASGWKQVCTFNDVARHAGFSFQGTGMWGRAFFSPKGHLARAEKPKTTQQALRPLTLRVPLPDRKARSVSMAVYDARGRLVRTLPAVTFEKAAAKRELEVRWDGLDDDGKPLPPGEYRLKVLSHRGVGQRWVASLHNAGNPPWRTDDGTGSWGGDHAPPIAAAADARRVYLGWMISEAGWAVIALKNQFTPDGKVQKLWGQHQVLDLGIVVTAIEGDGQRLFVAQDGKRWGERNPSRFTAGVVLWDAETGKPINFPFGKRVLVVSEWSPSLKPRLRPIWERLPDGDVGPQDKGLNLMGIALAGDTLYASLRLENKVVAFNWRTGKRLREFSVERPVGLTVARDSSLLVVSGKSLIRLDPASGSAATIVSGLSSPWDVAVDGDGRIYVTDCGLAMQVKVFARDGRPLATIGKAGGRPWVGRYDPEGMLMPAGIVVDATGKVWVTENDDAPRRVSVWTRDGRLVADLLGPGAYAVEGIADPRKPEWVNVHNTIFEVNYRTGETRTIATVVRPNLQGLQFTQDGGHMGRALKFRHLRGKTYVVHTGRGAVVVYRLRDDLVAEPLCATGDCGHLRFHLPGWFLEKLKPKPNTTFRWLDRNGDTFVQMDEIEVEPVPTTVRNYWGPWVDDDLSLWCSRGNEVYRVAVKEWLPNGVPVYPMPSEQKPLFRTLGDRVHYVMPGEGCVYVLEQRGGGARGSGARWQAISAYTLDGRRLWAYRRAWLGFGLEAPLAKPGDVVGAMKFIGKVTIPRLLARDIRLVAVNGYFGQFNILSGDGLWVASLCKDNRYGPVADSTTVWPENFSGHFFRNRRNGKVYLIAGDTDARIWEITGLETLRTRETSLRISEEDHRLALEAAAQRRGLPTALPPLVVRREVRVVVDGEPNEWELARKGAVLKVGSEERARVALAHDKDNLYVVFDVADPSPMKNSGKDFALLFKTGDACDLMLATDPAADPERTEPAPGDLRLLFSTLEGKPVAVLYRPVLRGGKGNPRTFSSPVSAVRFDHVAIIEEAKVAIRRGKGRYVLEAAVPLSALGWNPAATPLTRGDVGVIFSDSGGSRNVLRLYYANRDTAIVNDIPSEARLTPDKWGIVKVE